MNEKRHFKCALTIAQEEQVCAEYENGIRIAALAEKWGVANSSIWRTLRAYDVATSKRIYHYDEHKFAEIDNEAAAYFLGYLTTDGYIVEGPSRYVVTLTSTDPDIPRAFAGWLGEGIPVYEIPPGHQRRNSIEYRVSACSKIMVGDLVRLGVRQGKSMAEEFCREVPGNVLHHYMRGIIDGDGCVGIYRYGGRPQLMCSLVGSHLLLSEFAKRLQQHIDVPLRRPRLKNPNGLYKISYIGNILARDILAWLYQDAHIYLGRKRAIYECVKDQAVREWTNAHYGTLPTSA